MKRLVTGHDAEGQSIVISEGPPPRVLEPVPGYKLIELWATEEPLIVPDGSDGSTPMMTSFTPPVGGSRFRLFTIPPSEGMEEHDPAMRAQWKSLMAQVASQVPGLGERMELDDPGMHTTDTIDYIVVLFGEAELELDNKARVHLKPGDCVIQRGTRHAWRNRGTEPFVAAAVMIGAQRRTHETP